MNTLTMIKQLGPQAEVAPFMLTEPQAEPTTATYFGLTVRVVDHLHYYSLVERAGHEFVVPTEDLMF